MADPHRSQRWPQQRLLKWRNSAESLSLLNLPRKYEAPARLQMMKRLFFSGNFAAPLRKVKAIYLG